MGSDKKNYDFITAGFKNKDFTEYGECTECDEAISFIEEVLKDGRYKDFSIIITGHSLGALLSDVTLYHLNTKGNTNCKSIVFANPGSKTFLEKVASQNGEKLNSDLYKSVSLAINLKGDKLVDHKNQLGSEWFIDTDQYFKCPSFLDQPICTYAGNNHMLKNIRDAVNTFSAEQINTELPNGWELETKDAAEKAEADRKAAEKAEADRKAAEKAEADRKAAEKAEADRKAAEKAEADRKAAEKAEADRKAAEKAEADRKAAEKAEADRKAAEKAEADRKAAEKAEADRKAAEKAEADRKAAEKAEADRKAAEKAEADRKAAEKAEADRKAAEKAEADRKAAEKAAKDAADKAEAQEAIITIAKDEVLKKNLPINENNLNVLKNVNFDTLTAQYSKESVEDAITTIIARKQDFQQEHLPNLVKSHEIFSGSNTYTAEELDQAESCIMDGEC